MTSGLKASQPWKDLQTHFESIRDQHLRELFAQDPDRGATLAAEAVGIYLDYSKNRISKETMRLLFALAESCSLQERIEAMFRGEKINNTEQRAVLHTALRAPRTASVMVDGSHGDDIVELITRRIRGV